MRDVGRLARDLVALTGADTVLDPATLAAIGVPVLLIWGDTDHLADLSGAATLLASVAAARLVVLEDCGHCAHVESPPVVAGLLADLPGSALPDPPEPTRTEGSS
jgi:pimeloyl-ACP methyl ester carboxylesterase